MKCSFLSTFLITCRPPSEMYSNLFHSHNSIDNTIDFQSFKKQSKYAFWRSIWYEDFFHVIRHWSLYNVIIRLYILYVMFDNENEMEIKWHFPYQIQRKCDILLRLFETERFSNRQIDTPIVYIYLASKSSDFMRWAPSIKKHIAKNLPFIVKYQLYILCFNISFGFLVVFFSNEERHFV